MTTAHTFTYDIAWLEIQVQRYKSLLKQTVSESLFSVEIKEIFSIKYVPEKARGVRSFMGFSVVCVACLNAW